MVAVFSEIFNMSQWTTWFDNNPYFHKYSADFHVYLDDFFMRNMTNKPFHDKM